MPEPTVIARINKDELQDLQVKRQAVAVLKAQYLLAQRGWGAQIGEVIRRYKRADDERLRINLETGDVEIATEEMSKSILQLVEQTKNGDRIE